MWQEWCICVALGTFLLVDGCFSMKWSALIVVFCLLQMSGVVKTLSFGGQEMQLYETVEFLQYFQQLHYQSKFYPCYQIKWKGIIFESLKSKCQWLKTNSTRGVLSNSTKQFCEDFKVSKHYWVINVYSSLMAIAYIIYVNITFFSVLISCWPEKYW